MSPEIGQAATRIALFLIIGAGISLLLVPRDSAEFVVLVLTIGMGLIMLGVVALFARIGTTSRWDTRKGPPAGPLSGPPAREEPEGEPDPDERR